MFRILLIDDTVGDLAKTKKAVEALLLGHEYEITGVDGGNATDNGVETFKTAKNGEKPFGLVVTDYEMGYKTAMTVLEKIRQIDGEVPIVIVSKNLQRGLKDSVFRLSKRAGWSLTAVLSKNDIWSEETNLGKTEFETIVKNAVKVAQTEKTNAPSASTRADVSDLPLPSTTKMHHNPHRRTSMVFAIPPTPKRLIL